MEKVARVIIQNGKYILPVMLALFTATSYALEDSKCQGCIFVEPESGSDNSSCIAKGTTNSTAHCKTMSYVLQNPLALNGTSIVLLGGDHQLDQTLTVANVEGLIIRSAENAVSIIKCSHPANSDDNGSGLAFASVTNQNL